MKYRMSNKVWIISSRKTDGRYNQGIIVGVEAVSDHIFYPDEKSFFNSFKDQFKYKVAYVDCVTGKAVTQWIYEDDLSKTKPESKTTADRQ
jgi:hypothetical protein